jgi:2-phospho-L-lactate/phosphoenolpyruvate guanylyltransferase
MIPVILIPVKEQIRAKSRLSDLMTAAERAALAWAMFEDLIAALRPLPNPVILATNSRRAAERIASLSWRVIWEESQTSESASVDQASRILASEGIAAVLRLPADIPLAQSGDIAALFAALPAAEPSAVMVPSLDGRGTNALLRTPPGLFPSMFGPDSFHLHLLAATRAGVTPRIVENPRLALDVDTPADLNRFLAYETEGETWSILKKLDIPERLARYDVRRDSNARIAGNP